ncbi:MAG: hypothetical protein C4575_10675 [Desulforudis sp.]|nr:MAG: hypothetical protein C4575_10675 [Desulforudis sp.]
MTTPKLNNSMVILRLAKDLGIKKVSNPVEDILKFCEKRIKKILKEFPDCKTLNGLLDIAAAKLNTEFREIFDEEDLFSIKEHFVGKGEKIFSNLENELNDQVLGITFKIRNCESWEREFVSVIDCRGEKGFRAYFTKWHEIAHLLVLTDQQRLKFMRTNLAASKMDPEESMVDIIAGRFGFYPPFIQKNARYTELTFERIDAMRAELCPESSLQAALIGFVQAWPEPCILAFCKLALKKNQQALLAQQRFDFHSAPTLELRATKTTSNRSAKDSSFIIHKNMRVPKSSIIHVLFDGYQDYAEAEENLSIWESSDGRKLPDINITVRAKRYNDGIVALISPIE